MYINHNINRYISAYSSSIFTPFSSLNPNRISLMCGHLGQSIYKRYRGILDRVQVAGLGRRCRFHSRFVRLFVRGGVFGRSRGCSVTPGREMVDCGEEGRGCARMNDFKNLCIWLVAPR